MTEPSTAIGRLPSDQQAIRDKCVHPTGTFFEFKKEEIEQSIPARFEKIAWAYPDRIAIKTKDVALTYAELNKTANRLAKAIIARRGAGSEPVAIFLEHGASVIVAILGILKAGKIFVIIDPLFPKERIDYLLEDSQASLLITNNANLLSAKAYVREEAQLINTNELPRGLTGEHPGVYVPSDSLAVLVYTSGSTGRPKGVMQNHRNMLHTIMRDTNEVNFSPCDRLSLLRSTSTPGAIVDLFDGLLNGAAVYPYSLLSEGFAHLSAWLAQEEITVFNSVSSSFRQFLSLLSDENFPHLRLIYVGGETIHKHDVDLYKKHFSDECVLVVRLGCGEAGKVCQYMIDKQTEIHGNDIPVGYPHEDLKILILDDAGKQTSVGAVGEIAIRSRYLSPGYWRMPALTKTRFLLDPSEGDERIYLTGDMGFMTSDGCVFHFGRKDSQVKMRGFQVEVVEIERILLQHQSIREALVVSQEDHSGQPILVAYWVPNQWPRPTVSELRRHLQKELPAYMIPSIFMTLNAMPLTPTGKLDRRALPLPDNSRPELDTQYVAPTNPVEENVLRIWSEVLGINQIGIHDTFSDLGGHSLRAMQVISRILMTFKVELPIKFLLSSPTVEEMAALIIENQAKQAGREELARMLSELEGLSQEETERLRKEQ